MPAAPNAVYLEADSRCPCLKEPGMRESGAVDLRTRTSLFCGVLALAIAASILLRGRPRRAQVLFAALAGDMGLWYLAQWQFHAGRADFWERSTAVLAVLLPQFALHLFDSIVPRRGRPSALLRWA